MSGWTGSQFGASEASQTRTPLFSRSEGLYTPLKKAPAVKKAAATKSNSVTKVKAMTAPKAKPVASKKKVLVRDDNAEDSFMAVDAPRRRRLRDIKSSPKSNIFSQVMWTYDGEEKPMMNHKVSYVPDFFKIIVEILVNAADNKVDIDIEENTISDSVYNNGPNIPIEIHSKENCYIPELIFGHLLSGCNYDDDEKKLTGG
ncbi:hypothetical protein C8J56DRAFT_1117914 [Mycena floridula]|nr:hypothetical protein C8J56DRAFT_1117914 [Mycena floridula]